MDGNGNINNGDWSKPEVRNRFLKKRDKERNEWDAAYTPEMAAAQEEAFGSAFIPLSKYQFPAIRWALVLKAAKNGIKTSKHSVADRACWCSTMLSFLYAWQDNYRKLHKTINGKVHWFYCSIKAMEGQLGNGKELSLGLKGRQQQRYLSDLKELGLIEVESVPDKKNPMHKRRYIWLNFITIAKLFKRYRDKFQDKDHMDDLRDTGLF